MKYVYRRIPYETPHIPNPSCPIITITSRPRHQERKGISIMVMPKYAPKRDASEPEIVKALQDLGCTVERMDAPCDLLVGFRGVNYLVEAKTAGTQYGKKLNANQTDFNASWKGSKIIMLHSSVDAIDWIVGLASGTDREAKAA